MKVSTPVLALAVVAVCSLAVNVIIWPSSEKAISPRSVSESSVTQKTINKASGLNVQHLEDSALNVKVAETGDQRGISKEIITWHAEQNDYTTLASELQRVGMPASLVKLVILSKLEFDEKLIQLEKNKDYWRSLQLDRYKSVTESLDSANHQRETLVRIFGEEIKDDPEFYALFRPFQGKLAFLTSDKQIKLQELQLQAVANAETQSPLELENSIKQLLGPEDYYEYQLRESPVAKALQQELAAFDYTERDYRELYRIKQESNTQHYDSNGYPIQSAELSGADFNLNGINKGEDSIEQQNIRVYLGEERYNEYALSKQPGFRATFEIASANGVEKHSTIEAFEILEDARSDLSSLYQDTSLNENERSNRISELLNNTKNQVSTIVGESTAQQIVSSVLQSPQLHHF